jgi:hypothetical protein
MKQRTDLVVRGVAGAAVTLLHSLFFMAANWGGTELRQLPASPHAVGGGANRGTSDGDMSELRMTVHLVAEADTMPEQAPKDAFLEQALRISAIVHITGPDSLPLPPLNMSFDGPPAESTEAELIAREKFSGIYESQIRARIERAWKLPENAGESVNVTCRAMIRQHPNGRIHEVELPYEGCDLSHELRQSLIKAIFAASPLPAPPHPGVFTDSFSLVFRPGFVRRH